MRVLAQLLWLVSTAVAVADADAPKNVRVIVQYIEVPPAELTAMMADGQPGGAGVHAEVMQLVRKRRAAILESNVITTRGGQKATLESLCELIYPTEYGPGFGPPGFDIPFQEPPSPRPKWAQYFETRNVGVTLEVDPTIGHDSRMIELRLVPEVVGLVRFDTWVPYQDKWGAMPMQMPVFETWRVNTSVALTHRKFECLGVITPKPRQAPHLPRKILLFTRADVIDVKP